MTKILKVELENFQSHKKSIIELHKGLNVITGPSDSGKSAIIRAIRWVLYNEPRGTDFITTNTNQCKVSLYFDNGAIITRKRAAAKNRYILRVNGEEEIFEGFGNTVPSEIVESHKIRNLYLDTDHKSTINLATQLEGPFLLSQSGAIRAKAIGRILGIHYLDSASRKASSTINELKKDYTQKLEEQKRIKERLKDYGIYDQHQVKLEKAYANYSKLEFCYGRLGNLKKLNNKIKTINEDILDTKDTIAKTHGIKDLEKKLDNLSSLMAQKHKLSHLNLKIHQKSKEIDLAQKTICTTENHLELEKRIKSLNSLKEVLYKYKGLKNQYNDQLVELNKFSKLLHKTADIDLLEINISKLSAFHSKLQELNKVSTQLNSLVREKNSVQMLLQNTAKHNHIANNTNMIALLTEKFDKLNTANKKKKETELRITKGREFLLENTAKLNILIKQYQDILAKIPECPICESRIDGEKSKRLISKWRDVK